MTIRLLLTLLLLFLVTAATAQSRHALVIGNANYDGSAELKNPLNDARLMEKTLKQYGFKVSTHLNANRRTMKEAIQQFTRKLDQESIGLFYYAGHGLEVNGRNYLIPVGASISTEADVEFESIDAGRILKSFEVANNGLNMLILDACRNNPFSRGFRSVETQGLAKMAAPKGSLILYATQPGNVASDGAEDNGLFTQNLVASINTPGLAIEEVFKQTAIEVNQKSGDSQTPYIEGNILGDFFFIPPSEQEPIQVAGGGAGTIGQQKDQTTATLTIESEPAGATIRLNGGYAGATPKSFVRQAGKAEVKVEKSGYESQTETFTLSLGDNISYTFDLTPLNREPLNHPFTVSTTPANARVRILNIVPKYYDGIELKDGRYRIEVTADGYEKHLEWVEHGGRATVHPVTLSEIAQSVQQTSAPSQSSSRPTTTSSQQRRSYEPEMEPVPGGCYQMGSNSGDSDEKPVHRVCVDNFQMGKYEITWAQYQPCIDAGVCPNNDGDGGDNGWGKGNRPVIEVSWDDITQKYIPWLNRQTGKRYALPSEAQWEYAARGGTTTKYWWGDNIGRNNANCDGCGSQWDDKSTAPVGSFKPNAFGLYDMSGNVWEWVQDCWNNSYHGAPADGSAWESGECGLRVLRGGSWNFKPNSLRSADRNWNYTGNRVYDYGFRLILQD
ncbi:PEGA domain-containing protein [Ectothiorhodospiraceae bacterium BW-2]|nr:PEGA domain-containing protein [Ectothiorhodospiraceae bacterium BW-2]